MATNAEGRQAMRFEAGGTLAPDSPTYVTRSCDAELLDSCRRGDYAFVLSSRQMGKSSLMARTTVALRQAGVHVMAIDLTVIGSNSVDMEAWYLGVLAEAESACSLRTDLFAWWQQNAGLSAVQRFTRFFSQVVLTELEGPVVVFIDEIDSTLGITFRDDFFAAIRALHNERAQHPALKRLSFVLLGVATPAELIRDAARTPFNIGRRVEVADFNADEAAPLVAALGLPDHLQAGVVSQLLHWTGGQPYLTQLLCKLLQTALASHPAGDADLDALVREALLSSEGRKTPHFQFVDAYLRQSGKADLPEIFDTSQAALDGRPVNCRDDSAVHNRLRLSGLLKKSEGRLVYRNQLYREVFDRRWISRHRPTLWTQANRRLLAGAGVLVSLLLGLTAVLAWRAYDEARALPDQRANTLALAAQARLDDGDGDLALMLLRSALADRPEAPAVWEAFARLHAAHHGMVRRARIDEGVTGLALGADGSTALVLGASGAFHLWDLEAKVAPVRSGTLGEPASVLALSGDGTRVLVGTPSGKACVLDLRRAGPCPTWQRQVHRAPIVAAAFSPDGRLLVTAAGDGPAQLWSLAEGRARPLSTPGSGGGVAHLAGFDATSRRAWTAETQAGASLLRMWSVGVGSMTTEIRVPAALRAVAYRKAREQDRLVGLVEDRLLRQWNLTTDQLVGAGLPLNAADRAAEWIIGPGGDRLVEVGRESLGVWNGHSGRNLLRVDGRVQRLAHLSFIQTGRALALALADRRIHVLDAGIGMSWQEPATPRGGVTALALSKDARWLLAGSADGELRLVMLDPPPGSPGAAEAQKAGPAEPGGRRYREEDLPRSTQGTARASGDAARLQLLTQLVGPVHKLRTAQFSLDGKRVVLVREDGSAAVVDSVTRKPSIAEQAEGSTQWAAIDPAGHQVLIAGRDGNLRLLPLPSADTAASATGAGGVREARQWRAHVGGVRLAVFSEDGTRVASQGVDGSLRVWAVARGSLVADLPRQFRPVRSLVFVDQGSQLRATDEDQTSIQWDLRTVPTTTQDRQRWLEDMLGRITRPVTAAECKAYFPKGTPSPPAECSAMPGAPSQPPTGG